MRRLIACLALALFAGCGGDSVTGPTAESVSGTWTLQTINGAHLPFIIAQSGADKIEVTSDVITVVSGGTFTQLTQFRTTVDGVATDDATDDHGTWKLKGTALTFTFSDNTSGTATVSENTLTVTDEGTTLVYTKR